jgi:mono/diheme cytochrome c family protein
MDGRTGSRSRLSRIFLAMIFVGSALPARADDDIDRVLAEAGKARYAQYCTPCHGAGGAPGTAKSDLRTYVARHGGKFPAADWLAIIADTRPGSVHTDVWEKINRDQAGGVDTSVMARSTLGQIARYVNSIQSK